MKIFKYIICAASLGLVVTSCSDLDLDAKGVQDEATLFSSDAGVKTYLAALYNDLPIEDFNYAVNGDQRGYRNHDNNQWQALKSYSGSVSGETQGRNTGNGGGEDFDYWPYENIRMINTFLVSLPQYADKYTEQKYNELLAEGRFIRAFFYFGMAKRYGGVPIITEPQEPYAPVETLQVPRATEYDTWKFIYEDLKFAMENGSADKKEIARANRYTAAALMSRAMLYAASVAKYSGTVGTMGEAVNLGLQTMTDDHAEEFYQYVIDACKVVEAGGYKLHNDKDKEKAYAEEFYMETPGEEDIFVKRFLGAELQQVGDRMGLLHHWDAMVLPKGEGLSQFVGGAINPTWELMGKFEHPAVVDAAGKPVRFNKLVDFANSPELEPRAKACFFFPGMVDPVSGIAFDIQAGVYTSYPGTALEGCPLDKTSPYLQSYRVRAQNPGSVADGNGKVNGSDFILPPGTKVNGVHGLAEGVGDEGYSYTGAFIRKYVDVTSPASHRVIWGSTQSWKAFRYGEVLLNWAEACYELGLIRGDNALKQEAINHVNEVRERAGATPYTLNPSPMDIGSELYGMEVDENLEYIRDERARELCFEHHRYWDIRRWRIADAMFTGNTKAKTLLGYYVIDEDKYIFLNEYENYIGRTTSWNKSQYYRQIPGDQINKNPLLVRNDGF